MAETRIPIAISCDGGTPAARLAAHLVASLDELGAAEATPDIEDAVAAARAGRDVVALNGCQSACRSRVLDARGVRARALDVAELRATVDPTYEKDPAQLAVEAAAQLHSGRLLRPPRPSRPHRPAAATRAKRAHTVADYLLAIDALASTSVECGALAAEAPTLAAHVSRLLGVSRASAGEMLARLESDELVERSERKELLLTATGRVTADRAVSRHRLLERLASDFLGYPPAECYERARLLDDAFDPDAIERARRALGDPQRCPHGWPIDPGRARAESRELTTLAALADGAEATIVRIAEHDGALISRLDGLGLVPEAAVTVERHEHQAMRISVRTGGWTGRLDPAAAAGIFVRA